MNDLQDREARTPILNNSACTPKSQVLGNPARPKRPALPGVAHGLREPPGHREGPARRARPRHHLLPPGPPPVEAGLRRHPRDHPRPLVPPARTARPPRQDPGWLGRLPLHLLRALLQGPPHPGPQDPPCSRGHHSCPDQPDQHHLLRERTRQPDPPRLRAGPLHAARVRLHDPLRQAFLELNASLLAPLRCRA